MVFDLFMKCGLILFIDCKQTWTPYPIKWKKKNIFVLPARFELWAQLCCAQWLHTLSYYLIERYAHKMQAPNWSTFLSGGVVDIFNTFSFCSSKIFFKHSLHCWMILLIVTKRSRLSWISWHLAFVFCIWGKNAEFFRSIHEICKMIFLDVFCKVLYSFARWWLMVLSEYKKFSLNSGFIFQL